MYLAEAAGAAEDNLKFLAKTRSDAYLQIIDVAFNGQKTGLVFSEDREHLTTETNKA